MAANPQFYAQMAADAAKRVTGSREQWTAFLTTAARIYKYPYHDQLMIFAQRPEATACADYDFWRDTMHRYVKRGSKGIALVDVEGDAPKLRYVFDVADTGLKQNSRPVWLWSMKGEYREPVQRSLEQSYGVSADFSLEEQLSQAAIQLTSAYWEENGRQLCGIVANSFLEGYKKPSGSRPPDGSISDGLPVYLCVQPPGYSKFDLQMNSNKHIFHFYFIIAQNISQVLLNEYRIKRQETL